MQIGDGTEEKDGKKVRKRGHGTASIFGYCPII